MILLQPERTQGDLNFRLLGTDVRVHPLFWLMAAIFGWGFLSLGFQYLAIWVGCVFLSILVHEFGHVLMGRFFGTDGYIVLHSFGGLAVGSNNLNNSFQRILVSAAGPGIQFGLYGILLLIVRRVPPNNFNNPYLEFLLYCLLTINWYWPLMNLLPVFPLDGGQIVRDFLSLFIPDAAVRVSLVISAAVAGAIALNSLSAQYKGPTIPWIYTGGMYSVILFGYLAAGSIQAFMQENDRQRWVDRHRVEYDDDDWSR